ncbi:MAG: division/cell wall cluster transcriptional repressor MraZ [Actinobacteria bacterium]|nr:division/cell wall cluster transcriptional repressor MraZ [Actinomycetota bacterium]NIS33311.1 division/cell wall cluster transcriptional repressor MraZ [Actinomycetota bacterium]NIT96798.1 division/cell wall cluster transcriptional repressor MraZ [Actinomycetota bacterium]NIU20487.1 division/cell wall cluster transcriptional repressor MraZ [Actinomycetota bacterium]NIU68213.1 division/cell wall cluster transcriptional repressor MraZ [Actinomycetota bacterium]
MARFLGTFEHTLDGKGRLILPSAFRPKLAEGAVITSLDHCLAILPADEFERMADRLEAEVAEGDVDVNALRSFASQADEVVPDSQGRVRLLPHLREMAGLDRSVIVTGALRRVEVWNPDRWAEVSPAGAERLADAIERGHGIGAR